MNYNNSISTKGFTNNFCLLLKEEHRVEIYFVNMPVEYMTGSEKSWSIPHSQMMTLGKLKHTLEISCKILGK